MRRGALAVVALLVVAGCGEVSSFEEMRFALDHGSGLHAGDVGSVAVLVLGGAQATCDRAEQPHSPLDDPELQVLVHALFLVDGGPKHLSIPSGQHLVFYVDAYRSADGRRPRVGRGCAEGTLQPGQSTGVSITLLAAPDD